MKTENYTLLQRITRKLDAKLGSGGLGDIAECAHQMEMWYVGEKMLLHLDGIRYVLTILC